MAVAAVVPAGSRRIDAAAVRLVAVAVGAGGRRHRHHHPTAAVPAAARIGGYDGGADGELAARLESALAELQAARDGEAAAARREAELRESHRAELDAALEAARQEAKADLVAAATEHDRALHNQQFLAAKAAQEKREMESELEHWEAMHEEWEAEKKATAAAHAERLAAAEAALSKARDEATAERVRYQNAEGRAEGSAAAAARASELKDELEAAQASERYSALQAEMQAMKAAEAHAEADALRAKVRKLEKAAAKAAAAAEPVAAAAEAAMVAESSVAAEEELRGDTSSSSSSSSSGSGSDANGGGADAIAAVEKVVSLGAELKRTLTTAGGASPPPTRPAAAANASPDRGSRAVLGRTVRELNRQQLQVAALREKLSVVEASAGAAAGADAAALAGTRTQVLVKGGEVLMDHLVKAHDEVESLQSEVARLSQTAEAEKGYSQAMDAECERLKKAYADLAAKQTAKPTAGGGGDRALLRAQLGRAVRQGSRQAIAHATAVRRIQDSFYAAPRRAAEQAGGRAAAAGAPPPPTPSRDGGRR